MYRSQYLTLQVPWEPRLQPVAAGSAGEVALVAPAVYELVGSAAELLVSADALVVQVSFALHNSHLGVQLTECAPAAAAELQIAPAAVAELQVAAAAAVALFSSAHHAGVGSAEFAPAAAVANSLGTGDGSSGAVDAPSAGADAPSGAAHAAQTDSAAAAAEPQYAASQTATGDV